MGRPKHVRPLRAHARAYARVDRSTFVLSVRTHAPTRARGRRAGGQIALAARGLGEVPIAQACAVPSRPRVSTSNRAFGATLRTRAGQAVQARTRRGIGVPEEGNASRRDGGWLRPAGTSAPPPPHTRARSREDAGGRRWMVGACIRMALAFTDGGDRVAG